MEKEIEELLESLTFKELKELKTSLKFTYCRSDIILYEVFSNNVKDTATLSRNYSIVLGFFGSKTLIKIINKIARSKGWEV